MGTDIDAEARGKVIRGNACFAKRGIRTVLVLVFLPVLGWTKGLITYGPYAFGLTDTAIVQYDRTSYALVRTIGFFGKPRGIDSSNAFYLLTSRGLFRADPQTGRFVDIFPLYEYPVEMFLHKKTIALVTQNELLVFDCSGKLKVKLGIFLTPGERVGALSPVDGRLYLAKRRGGLEVFEAGKQQLRMLPLPAGVTKIVAAGKVLYCAGSKEVFEYDWAKGKVTRRLPVSGPVADCILSGNLLVVCTDREIAAVDIGRWQIVKKMARAGLGRLAIGGDRLFAGQGKRILTFGLPGLADEGEKNFPEPVKEFVWDPETQGIVARIGNQIVFEGGLTRVETPLVTTETTESSDSLFAIQVGAFGSKANADNVGLALNKKGVGCYVVEDKGVFKVRVGFFRSRDDAQVAKTGLQEYPSWVLRDKVVETAGVTPPVDLNTDGNPDWVINPGDRVVIFSEAGGVYQKIWESPADRKIRVVGVGPSSVSVENGGGTKGTLVWSGGEWKLLFSSR